MYLSRKSTKEIGRRPPLSLQLWQIQDGRHFLCKSLQNATKNELMNIKLCFWCKLYVLLGQEISETQQ